MVGYLVVHNQFGPGKIVGWAKYEVYILTDERQMMFGKAAIDEGSFVRNPLYPGSIVKSNRGYCRITKFLTRNQTPHLNTMLYMQKLVWQRAFLNWIYTH